MSVPGEQDMCVSITSAVTCKYSLSVNLHTFHGVVIADVERNGLILGKERRESHFNVK